MSATLAQLVEQSLRKGEVVGSIPTGGSTSQTKPQRELQAGVVKF